MGSTLTALDDRTVFDELEGTALDLRGKKRPYVMFAVDVNSDHGFALIVPFDAHPPDARQSKPLRGIPLLDLLSLRF